MALIEQELEDKEAKVQALEFEKSQFQENKGAEC